MSNFKFYDNCDNFDEYDNYENFDNYDNYENSTKSSETNESIESIQSDDFCYKKYTKLYDIDTSIESSSFDSASNEYENSSNDNESVGTESTDLTDENSNTPSESNNDLDDGFYTCTHSKNQYEIIAPCCDEIYLCYECHNQHKQNCQQIMTSKSINRIACLNCGLAQNLGEKCTRCNIKFNKYWCEICRIHSDCCTPNIFHCNSCDICYYGNKKKYIHSDETNRCVLIQNDQITTNDVCCLCLYELKLHLCTIMSCNHVVHHECYTKLVAVQYKCPLCSKTIKNMKNEFKKMQANIKADKMTDAHTHTVQIKCFDCNTKSIVFYHYIGLKCVNCNSFNTLEIK